MSFGMYLLAVFCSPIYFVVHKRWGAFVINAILYTLALLTIMIFGIGVVFWALGTLHAIWDLRMRMADRMMQRQAELIAQKMAKSE